MSNYYLIHNFLIFIPNKKVNDIEKAKNVFNEC